MFKPAITQMGQDYLTPASLHERIKQQDELRHSQNLGKFITARQLLEGSSDKMATLLDGVVQ